MLLIGTGAAVCFPALMTLAMSGATPEDAGLASGLVNTTVQVGGALGLAVLATLSATETASRRAAGESVAAALNGGYHLAYSVAAGLVLVAIAIALVVLKPGAAGEARARDAQVERRAVASPRTRRRRRLGQWHSSAFAARSARSPAGARSTRSTAPRSASCCASSSGRSPALRGWILDERGLIRRHINVFVNGERGERGHAGRRRRPVDVLPAISGG